MSVFPRPPYPSAPPPSGITLGRAWFLFGVAGFTKDQIRVLTGASKRDVEDAVFCTRCTQGDRLEAISASPATVLHVMRSLGLTAPQHLGRHRVPDRGKLRRLLRDTFVAGTVSWAVVDVLPLPADLATDATVDAETEPAALGGNGGRAIASGNIAWSGVAASVQPRIRLHRSFDERSHSYLGYVLTLRGTVDGAERVFSVAIGEGAEEKLAFRVGDTVSGEAVPVADPRLETAEFYKASKLKLTARADAQNTPPPWHGEPPTLAVYRERGHRRLDARTFESKCSSCIWGCRMPVEMIVDHWNPSGSTKYRTETFCYGPKSCPFYKPGPTRKVPGRNGMSYEEEDWIDDEAVAHRGPDE